MGIAVAPLQPDLMAVRRVLVVAPHPDDATIGAGATLARLAAQGARVVVVNVTSGERGTIDPNMTPKRLGALRQAEEQAASRQLGVAEVRFLGFADFSWLSERELTLALLAEVRKEAPDALFFPDPWLVDEGHPDHRTVGLAAASALIGAGLPLVGAETGPAVSSPFAVMYATHRPNLYLPAGEFWQRKRDALAAHQSQFPGELPQLLMGYWQEQSANWPGGAGPKEALRVVAALLMHMAPQVSRKEGAGLGD